ncbi:MAG: SIR2 family protein [Sphingobacteriaceae bacterium]|nr:MAG: SIR2 family protein [Sphingobacteriaceae bacterium]
MSPEVGTTDVPAASTPVSPVQSVLEDFDCQPVLFIGSGISRRYLGLPDWEGLLRHLLAKSDAFPAYEYLSQKFGDDKIHIGSAVSDLIFDWAWKAGKNKFEQDTFKSSSKSIFIKSLIADYLSSFDLSSLSGDKAEFAEELEALHHIRPHAVITTNYDGLAEQIFYNYKPIVGNDVIRYDMNAFGEIFHIHGSISDPKTIVITDEYYSNWFEDSKYIAARLLTYFAEHPVFIFGYGLGDFNVKRIIADVGRLVADTSGLISNVVQVIWDPNQPSDQILTDYAVVSGEDQYRIKVLRTNSLLGIFKEMHARHELKNVNPELLRALAARILKLTRHDIPNGSVEVSYGTLEGIAADEKKLPSLLGLTSIENINQDYPFISTMIAKEIGVKGPNQINKLFSQILEETGYDIKESDNYYHCRVKTGTKDSSFSRKYSHAAVALLKAVKNGEKYNIKKK